MSKQATFDKVVGALRAQKGASVVSNDSINLLYSCRYRGENGYKCAAGHLIPDHLYDESMEGKRIGYDFLLTQIIKDEGHDIFLVQDLQFVHDCLPDLLGNSDHAYTSFEHDWLEDCENWEDGFQQVAERHGLKYES